MADLMEKIVSLCKRRGFIFQSSEIYGGVEALWDYGPLGSLLKNNIKEEWLKNFVQKRENIVLIDTPIIMHPKTWEASGHLKNFTDPLIECKNCHNRFRSDQLIKNDQIGVQHQIVELFNDFFNDFLSGAEHKADQINYLTEELKQELEKKNYSGREIELILKYFKKAASEAFDLINYDVSVNAEGYFEGGWDFQKAFRERFSEMKLKNLAEQIFLDRNIKCPDCGSREWSEVRQFNLMFKTFLGPIEDESHQAYLRPETAQSMFTDFKQVQESMRLKIPFGIAQIGRSFRNEITTGNFTFRSREFEQAEIEYFVKPGEDEKIFEDWLLDWEKFIIGLGIKKENLRRYEHKKEDLSHYSKRTVDIEYKYPFGWLELTGIADRTDYDLSQHSKFSRKELNYFDEETKEKYVPYVIEPSLGIDRLLLALLVDAYEEIKGGRTETTKSVKEEEIILRLNKKIAPIKVAVLPLVKNKPDLVKKAQEVYQSLKPYFVCMYDEVGSIGRRYRRQDEIGTPFAITVDFETLEKNDVTVRDRDTMKQERIKITDLVNSIKAKLEL